MPLLLPIPPFWVLRDSQAAPGKYVVPKSRTQVYWCFREQILSLIVIINHPRGGTVGSMPGGIFTPEKRHTH
jgi:hypothetical protein